MYLPGNLLFDKMYIIELIKTPMLYSFPRNETTLNLHSFAIYDCCY